MRIALVHGSTTTWLAGEPGVSERDHTSASDFEIDANTEIDVKPGIRAEAVNVLDRGNLKTTLGFSTTVKFDTTDEAELWAIDYDGSAARAGTLTIYSHVSGEADAVRELANAVVKPPRRRVIGCSVLLTYSVTGGAFTVVEAEPEP